jgi:hypothetical protein
VAAEKAAAEKIAGEKAAEKVARPLGQDMTGPIAFGKLAK